MAGGSTSAARELDKTPTWAVALTTAVIIIISIILEKVIHAIGEWFESRRKKALVAALEKIKGELMVLGFISLLLTFGQNYIAGLCIKEKYANTMLPCRQSYHAPKAGADRRKLLWNEHRILATGSAAKGCKPGTVPLISYNGLHQLHIFIFFLAVFHVLYSALTMTLGRAKEIMQVVQGIQNMGLNFQRKQLAPLIRGWKYWEREIVHDYDLSNDPSRFRLTHETSFVKGHTSFWTKTPFLFYIACFFRQFFTSVRKADYLTMRHGFISVHLAPGSKFDFQKYIKRSLEDDFRVVVGISPLLWASAVIYLLLNVDGWQAMFWLSIMPLVVNWYKVILAVGTKLQAIIAQMAVEIQERHAVVQGIPLVQVSDRHFWFSWPKLILYLLQLTLFQNAFEITYFIWIMYEFGLKSCFNDNLTLALIRCGLGVGAQILCSYITLPLYALVTQMGSTMKRSIFDEQTNKALMNWQKNALKKKNDAPTATLGGRPAHEPPVNSPTPGARNPDQSGIEMSNAASTPSPRRAANITTSVDIPEERNPPPDRDTRFQPGKHDLLTGP
ncbi:hypothetical protein RJ639_012336 [Escallonia herrerae]|uniref:MLO-like protein n=1 Tax=Escallonia herrerae TaxID=1293975 RepID=A0AA89AQP1_9ASTE|nr:hypothetical protein RJ639_012336 [Escallonia herrerae]